MEKLLVYNTDAATYAAVRQIAGRMKITCVPVSAAYGSHTLGQLFRADAQSLNASAPASPAAESLLILCNLSDKRMDKLLFELRKGSIALDYKAILTPTNEAWTVHRLMLELQREKESIALQNR